MDFRVVDQSGRQLTILRNLTKEEAVSRVKIIQELKLRSETFLKEVNYKIVALMDGAPHEICSVSMVRGYRVLVTRKPLYNAV
jgi:hypothetical protein